jgi:hypothetical protein
VAGWQATQLPEATTEAVGDRPSATTPPCPAARPRVRPAAATTVPARPVWTTARAGKAATLAPTALRRMLSAASGTASRTPWPAGVGAARHLPHRATRRVVGLAIPRRARTPAFRSGCRAVPARAHAGASRSTSCPASDVASSVWQPDFRPRPPMWPPSWLQDQTGDAPLKTCVPPIDDVQVTVHFPPDVALTAQDKAPGLSGSGRPRGCQRAGLGPPAVSSPARRRSHPSSALIAAGARACERARALESVGRRRGYPNSVARQRTARQVGGAGGRRPASTPCAAGHEGMGGTRGQTMP